MRIGYRLGQFWQILTAVSLPLSAKNEITAVLSPTEAQLFDRYAASDQWHSYRVMLMLKSQGQSDPDLLAAALLHDIGKTCQPLSIWERSLIVLASFFLPRQTVVWGQGKAAGWRRPFVVKAQHPNWGADLAAEAGSSKLTQSLIRHHQDPASKTAVTKDDKALRLLQWADDQC